MIDGTAQLWQNSSQWFCLVCRHLLESGVVEPATFVDYFFRDDNNNAIAVSPFLWEVSGHFFFRQLELWSWLSIHLLERQM